MGIPALFLFGCLRTQVRPEGLFLRFAHFHLRYRRWRFDDIAEVVPTTYSPLVQLGGWGIRRGIGTRGYNVKGTTAIQLVLRSGERVLIGTQDPDRFMAAVARAWRERA